MSVGEKGVGRQVRDALLDGIRDHTACARDRLAAALEHERETHRQPRAVRPEAGWVVVGRIDCRRRGAGGARQATGAGGDGERCRRADGLKSLVDRVAKASLRD
jgi:hypothetical protein